MPPVNEGLKAAGSSVSALLKSDLAHFVLTVIAARYVLKKFVPEAGKWVF